MRRARRQRPAADLLVQLRELPAQRRPTVAEDLQHVRQTVRRARCGASKTTSVRRSAASPARRRRRSAGVAGRKPSKTKASDGRPDTTTAARSRRGTRDGFDRQACGDGRVDQPVARIGDRRASPPRRRGRPIARPSEPLKQLRRPDRLVVLVVGDERRPDAVVGEQLARRACVLGGDHVDLAEHAERAQRDVGEVADRRRDDEQAPRSRTLLDTQSECAGDEPGRRAPGPRAARRSTVRRPTRCDDPRAASVSTCSTRSSRSQNTASSG